MRASRRTIYAATRTFSAALIGAAALACVPAISNMVVMAQVPSEIAPEEMPPSEPILQPEQPGLQPEQPGLQPEQPNYQTEPPLVQPESEDGIPPRREHDRARDAVREGQALPLGNIIRELQRTCPGTFLNAILEDRDGRLVYRLQTLSTAGRRLFTIVDAATGAVVSGGCR